MSGGRSYIDPMRLARLAVLMLLLAAVAVGTAAAQSQAPGEEEAAAERPLPRCFGAAVRDPLQPCRNRRLSKLVRPHPLDALLEPNSECELGAREGELTPCTFGVGPAEAAGTVALIGDSHAAHWRAAIDAVVADKRWHGVSFTKAGCPLSTAVSDIPEPGKTKCSRWKRQLFRWFADHPEVQTVITSNHTGGKVVGANGRHFSAHA